MIPQARSFAINAHGDQRYGDRPYVFHLEAVAKLLAPHGETAQVIGYLHDVIEDTAVTKEQIQQHFGELVAECVSLLTDLPGANRQERKAKTYAKLAQVNGSAQLALIVKTADRLANVQACIADHKQTLWEVYRSEHPAFKQAAYRRGLCDPLWNQLDPLLESWGSNINTP